MYSRVKVKNTSIPSSDSWKVVLFGSFVILMSWMTSPFLVAHLVFSQSSCEVSASLTDVGGMAVRAIDPRNCALSVPLFVLVFDVSQ